jgi:hypothetical protein
MREQCAHTLVDLRLIGPERLYSDVQRDGFFDVVGLMIVQHPCVTGVTRSLVVGRCSLAARSRLFGAATAALSLGHNRRLDSFLVGRSWYGDALERSAASVATHRKRDSDRSPSRRIIQSPLRCPYLSTRPVQTGAPCGLPLWSIWAGLVGLLSRGNLPRARPPARRGSICETRLGRINAHVVAPPVLIRRLEEYVVPGGSSLVGIQAGAARAGRCRATRNSE